MRYLCWTPANLGGYSFTRADVMEMPWDEADDHMSEAGQRRRKEIEAMPKPKGKAR